MTAENVQDLSPTVQNVISILNFFCRSLQTCHGLFSRVGFRQSDLFGKFIEVSLIIRVDFVSNLIRLDELTLQIIPPLKYVFKKFTRYVTIDNFTHSESEKLTYRVIYFLINFRKELYYLSSRYATFCQLIVSFCQCFKVTASTLFESVGKISTMQKNDSCFQVGRVFSLYFHKKQIASVVLKQF